MRWPRTRLAQACSLKTGKLDSNQAVENGTYPFFTCAPETLRIDKYTYDTEAVLLAGNNASGIYPLKYFKGKFEAYQRTYILETLDENVLNIRYLYYALIPLLGHLQSVSIGAATQYLTKVILDNLEVPVPVVSAQRKIVRILSAYDELIANNLRRIALLEEAARLLYQEWFVRLRFPGHEHTRVVDGVPEGWEKVTLSDVCEIEDGDWIESKDQGGDDFRLLQISNIGVGTFVETGRMRFISEETFKRLNCREVTPGDILVARMPDPIGRGWLVTEMPWRMVTAVDLAIVKAKPNRAEPHFLIHHINSPYHLDLCSRRAIGATRPRIARRDLISLPIVIPLPALQRNFREIVAPIHDLKANLRQQCERFRSARDLLLPRLMSGEIAV